MCSSQMALAAFYGQEGNKEQLYKAKANNRKIIMIIPYILILPFGMLCVWLLCMPHTPWDLLEKLDELYEGDNPSAPMKLARSWAVAACQLPTLVLDCRPIIPSPYNILMPRYL